MARDNTNFQIIQISDTEWGIQYSDGTLIKGYSTRSFATQDAQTRSTDPSSSPVDLGPQNLEQALVVAQSARDAYATFIGNNPSATEEQKDAYAAQIVAANAKASEYEVQQAQAIQNSLAADAQRRSVLNLDTQIANALQQSKLASQDAASAHANATIIGYTPDQLNEFDNRAFATEAYYDSLANNRVGNSRLTGIDGTTSLDSSSLASGGSKNFTTSGGQISSGSSSQSSSSDGTLDVINTTLSNLFGSIGSSAATSNSVATGYGSNQYAGSVLYDTSTGVTSVNSNTDQRVKLGPKPSQASTIFTGVLAPLADAGGLVFPYTPSIELQGSTNYNSLEPVQSNQSYQLYQNTPSIDVQIQGIFTAQNDIEAKYMLACIHFLRVYTKMHFGASDANKGLPPPQLLLNGYGTYMFNGLSVILRNYSTQLPENVDYVSVQDGSGTTKVPVMTTLSVLVTVQQTPTKAKTFDWDSFAKGDLMQQKGWI